MCLLNRNLFQFLHNIPFENIPKTFYDAVLCAHRLAVKFLWIDSLCIIQDSIKDWAEQSAFMTIIYSNSFLNLAADVSRNSSEGLFRSPSPTDPSPRCLKLGSQSIGFFSYHFVNVDYWDTEIRDSILNSRAWVFQETMLAPCTLYFGSSEIFW